jgi:hypothetical protein
MKKKIIEISENSDKKKHGFEVENMKIGGIKERGIEIEDDC